MSNEHDITKAILETIRLNKITNIKSLNEEEEKIIDLEGDELKGEEAQFSNKVTPRVQFGPFKIYPAANNASFGGKTNSGIEWQYSIVDGVYINIPNLELDDEMVETIKRINAYYVEWVDTWTPKVNNEYKNG